MFNLAGTDALFSYEEKDPTGPDKWAKLNKGWAACGDGKKQSPIDISEVKTKKDMGPLEQTYEAAACTMENRGHDFIVIPLPRTIHIFTNILLPGIDFSTS